MPDRSSAALQKMLIQMPGNQFLVAVACSGGKDLSPWLVAAKTLSAEAEEKKAGFEQAAEGMQEAKLLEVLYQENLSVGVEPL